MSKKRSKKARRSKERSKELNGLTPGHVDQILRRKSVTRVSESKKKYSRKRLKSKDLEY